MADNQERVQEEIQFLKGRIACLEEERSEMSDYVKQLEQQRAELMEAIEHYKVEYTQMTAEFSRLHSEIFHLQTALGMTMKPEQAQTLTITPASIMDTRETMMMMAMHEETPRIMARIIPHDKTRREEEAYAAMKAELNKRKPGL